MEPDGERRGGEAERRGRRKLGRLLEAIESSEVLEKRIPPIKMLEGSSQFSADDLGLILQVLLASWIDSTCSGVSHCRLHRSILQVALKCSDLDITDHLGQFLTLGAKASSWCGKHLQWSVKSIDESELFQEEEHNRLRLEVNSLSFSISTKLFGIAAKCITILELEVPAGGGGKGVWPEQECLLNKADTEFPTLNTMEAEVEHLAVGLRTKAVQQMAPWSLLSPPPQEAPRHRCMHCGTGNTPKWRPGPNGPGTLCNACGHPQKNSAAAASSKNTFFREGQLLHSNTRRPPKKRCHSSKENYSAAGNDVGSSLDDFFDHTETEESWEPESSEEEELEWLLNKGAFSSVETMAGEVEQVLALDAPRARTKGRRRVTAMETTCRRANVLSHGDLRGEKAAAMMRRCTHCAAEKTPQWREGPEGPGTLCNACGVVFNKKGVLLPEYRPATSPAFSPLLHSNRYSRALKMHRRKGTTSAACHGEARSELMEGQLLPPANSPASFSTLQHHSLLRQSEEETSAAVGATSKASPPNDFMEVQQQPLPERPPADRPAFSLVYHRRVLECHHKRRRPLLSYVPPPRP